MTFICDLTHIPWRNIRCAKIKLSMSRISEVIALQPANACMVASRHVTKMAVTPLDPPYQRTKAVTRIFFGGIGGRHSEARMGRSLRLEGPRRGGVYELDPFSCRRYYRMCKYMNILRQGFRKLSSDRQSETTKIIKHATSRMVNIIIIN